MDRRSLLLTGLLTALAPASASWAALARVEIAPALNAAGSAAAPSASALSVMGAVPFTAVSAPLSAPVAHALVAAPAASMAASMPTQAVAHAPVALYAAAPAEPAPLYARDESGHPVAIVTLTQTAATAQRDPGTLSRVFDAAAAPPAAPDFAVLTPVQPLSAPTPWKTSGLMKPFADAVNAWRSASHERKLRNLPPEQRLTSEEMGVQQALLKVHSALSAGRYQDALTLAATYFQNDHAARWYEANPRFYAYREKGREYIRFAERAVMRAYIDADRRGDDPVLIAEARVAAAAGLAQGHAWRPTAIQAKDTGTCVQNSLFNAIEASVGFTRPTTVADFVAASRELLNRDARLDRPATRAEIAALSKDLGLDLGRLDVAEGMGSKSLRDWASALGLSFKGHGAPRAARDWDALLAPGQENLLSLRMFHPNFPHTDLERRARGHDLRLLHHEVYLLGAFDSPSLGRRLYLLQDSGSGATLMATAEELSTLTTEVQQIAPAAPVSLPRP